MASGDILQTVISFLNQTKRINMGLDMRPMGKAKAGYEKRFVEIFEMLSKDDVPGFCLISAKEK